MTPDRWIPYARAHLSVMPSACAPDKITEPVSCRSTSSTPSTIPRPAPARPTRGVSIVWNRSSGITQPPAVSTVSWKAVAPTPPSTIQRPPTAPLHTGINATGQIVGDYGNASGLHGFLKSGSTYTTLDDPSASTGTQALGINDSGLIVGVYGSNTGIHGFLYTRSTACTHKSSQPGLWRGRRLRRPIPSCPRPWAGSAVAAEAALSQGVG
jgi:hypothetical protein